MASMRFEEVYQAIEAGVLTQVVANSGTVYRLEAKITRKGGAPTMTILARPHSGEVRIHADCFLAPQTCQKTYATGVNAGLESWWKQNAAR